MRLFIFSDAHGDYKALMKGLKEAGYKKENPNHLLISCGDNFGRATSGEKNEGSYQIYKYLRSKTHINKPVVIRGNHCSILLHMIERRDFSGSDYINGELKTLGSFAGLTEDETFFGPDYAFDRVDKLKVADWIRSLPWYFETQDMIFTHGWIPWNEEELPEKLEDIPEEEWDSFSWCNSIDQYKKFIKSYPIGYKKWIIIGHFGAWIFRKEIFNDGKDIDDFWVDEKHKVAVIDQTTVRSHKIKIFIAEDNLLEKKKDE